MDDVSIPGSDGDGHPLASVELWSEGPAQIVKVSGELDISNIDSLREALDQIPTSPPPAIVFDLCELRFIDSSGIALLLTTAHQVPSVQVRQPTPAVRRVIEITGLTDVLPIEP